MALKISAIAFSYLFSLNLGDLCIEWVKYNRSLLIEVSFSSIYYKNMSKTKINTNYQTSAPFWRSKSTTYTSQNSPNKINKSFLSKVNSVDISSNTENSVEFTKKSICDIRYYLQVHKKKQRTALISKNFQESNASAELCQHMFQRGMKGSKVQNRKGFRKNKYIEMDEIGCLQPPQARQRASSGLIARYNKPNLMYNLDLFRKKQSKDLLVKKKSLYSTTNQANNFFSHMSWHPKMARTVKTQQDRLKMRTLSHRQKS